MRTHENNYAYIDGANLHKGVNALGWHLDYARFRVWLREKYGVERAYLFIGLLPRNTRLYERLQKYGYILVFKQIAYDGDGRVKGNCDADLVLHAVSHYYEQEYDQAILITGDGDFTGLAEFLLERKKLKAVLAPDHKKCSILLKRTGAPITYLEEFRQHLGRKEKAPDGDETP
ncbi:MAG TPA: NYN domain-containing protein [Candidatus Wunengus californicus]|uniref:NYN domain-containing protein n=1 Tax=Candidatus Wunengus californicus TaxID=3367619 RepID=UPI00402636A5